MMEIASRSPQSTRKILVVEDEAVLAMLIEEIIRSLGFEEVEVAHSLAGATDAFERFQPDLVVLDLNLDGELSVPLAEHILETQIPLIIATGMGRHDVPATCADALVLTKPYGFGSVAKALQSLGWATSGE